jgi:hypothetical protein
MLQTQLLKFLQTQLLKFLSARITLHIQYQNETKTKTKQKPGPKTTRDAPRSGSKIVHAAAPANLPPNLA